MFKDHIFPKYEKTRLMKPQIEGFGDPTLKRFSLLDSSALMKSELKDGMFEDEFIRSFLNAAKVLASAGREAIDRPGMYVMLKHSYAIPVLFLTRHCMELAIKRAIRKCGREPRKDHNLLELWSSLLSEFPEHRGREDRRAIKNMGAFVGSIADIDDNGISLRYPSYKTGKLTQDRILFVNDEEVASHLKKFVEQLELIDFDLAGKDGS